MNSAIHLPIRLRRLRKTPAIRALIREHQLTVNDLVYPIFIKEGLEKRQEITTLPGVFQIGLTHLKEEINEIANLGINAIILFGIPKDKDAIGSHALSEQHIVAEAIKTIKNHNTNLCVIADLCFCEYTEHGHCGVIENNRVNNDKTLENLQKQAVILGKAGADIIAPSGMMDGMIAALREALDKEQLIDVGLLSYSAKYSSSFYGPFRDAAGFSLQFGDRKQYQMDIANRQEAIREVSLDISESTDMVMVKPAGLYLDVIHQIKDTFPEIPLCAYQVSGEYALIKHGAKVGLIDEQNAMIESLIAIKRAGADFIITYFAKEMARHIR